MSRIMRAAKVCHGEYLITALAFVPLLTGLLNLRAYTRVPQPPKETSSSDSETYGLSVLIPARNECHQIVATIRAVLANGQAVQEVIVLDDNSQDGTAAEVELMGDPRVKVIYGRSLLKGWCGKNHACAQLAAAATQPWLLFLDADVRIASDALSRLSGLIRARPSFALVSGVPHQKTQTSLEWLLLPFINVLLVGYLPLFMDTGRSPALAAACGQLILVNAEVYRRVGGHASISDKLHDGLALARLMRGAGYRTKLVDATDLASCRMYRNGREVYAGLMKNAVEGLAGPTALPIWTLLLGGAHVLPFLLRASPAIRMARLMSLGLRLLVALQYRQGLCTVIASPLGTFLLLFIQFHARLRHILGHPVTWKGRRYET